MSSKSKGIKIPRQELIIFISLVPFLRPDFFSYVSGLNKLYELTSYAGLVILLMQFIFLWISRKIRIHIFAVLVLLLNVVPIPRMLMVSGWNGEPMKLFVSTLALVLLVEIYQSRWILIVRALMIYFELIVYMNFITIILFPGGLYHQGLYTDNWLLGYSNSEIKYFILAGLVAIVYESIMQSRVRSTLLCVVVAISILRLDVVTGIVGILAMVVLYWLQKKKIKIFNLRNMAIVTAVIFVYFIVQQKIVEYVGLIEELTGKTVTFTSRFDIWNRTILFWQKNPLLGWGWKSSGQRGIEYDNVYATNAHNTYLEYLYLGGIIELAIFIFIIYAIYRAGKNKSDCKVKQATYACIGGFLIMMLTEAYTAPVVQLLYLVAYFALYNLPKVSGKKRTSLAFEQEIEE